MNSMVKSRDLHVLDHFNQAALIWLGGTDHALQCELTASVHASVTSTGAG